MKKTLALFTALLMICSSITTAFALSPPYIELLYIPQASDITMWVGDTVTLKAIAMPVWTDSAYITWVVDNENILSLDAPDSAESWNPPVSCAKITALTTGEVTLTAYASATGNSIEYSDAVDTVKITIVEPDSEIPFESGDGSESNPYIINTSDQLAYLAQRVNEGVLSLSCKSYKLGSDVDLSAYGKDYNDGKGWTPIGVSYCENGGPKHFAFKGVFDGNGHKITGLYINDPVVSYYNYNEDAGLFGFAEDCTIRNLRIVNASVFGGGLASTGSIAGYLQRGVVENCYATGTAGYVTYDGPIEGSPPSGGGGSVGGLVGNVDDSEVRNSYSAVDVTNGWYAGGIAATIDCGGSIINCYSTGDVNGSAYVGGIAGINWDLSEQAVDGKIENCYSTGLVTGGNDYVEDYIGGIIGYADSVSVINCAALNPCIKGDENVGRIAGLHHFYKDSVMSGNYAFDTIKDTNGEITQWTNKGHDQFDGEDMTENDAQNDSFWRDTMGFDTKVWVVEDNKLPVLSFDKETLTADATYDEAFGKSNISLVELSLDTENGKKIVFVGDKELYYNEKRDIYIGSVDSSNVNAYKKLNAVAIFDGIPTSFTYGNLDDDDFVDGADLQFMKLAIKGSKALEGKFLIASDVVGDGLFDGADLQAMKLKIKSGKEFPVLK